MGLVRPISPKEHLVRGRVRVRVEVRVLTVNRQH